MSETTNATPVAEKKTRVAKANVTTNGNVLTFTFASGNTMNVDYDKLTDAMKVRSGLHGLEQKFRDSYAGAESADEAYGMAQKVMDHVFDPTEPKWNSGREGGPSEDSLDLLAQAIVIASEAKGKTRKLDNIRVFLDTIDKAGRAKLRTDPGVMVALATLKAAKATDGALDSIPD